jgi:hypothetical protein
LGFAVVNGQRPSLFRVTVNCGGEAGRFVGSALALLGAFDECVELVGKIVLADGGIALYSFDGLVCMRHWKTVTSATPTMAIIPGM